MFINTNILNYFLFSQTEHVHQVSQKSKMWCPFWLTRWPSHSWCWCLGGRTEEFWGFSLWYLETRNSRTESLLSNLNAFHSLDLLFCLSSVVFSVVKKIPIIKWVEKIGKKKDSSVKLYSLYFSSLHLWRISRLLWWTGWCRKLKLLTDLTTVQGTGASFPRTDENEESEETKKTELLLTVDLDWSSLYLR